MKQTNSYPMFEIYYIYMYMYIYLHENVPSSGEPSHIFYYFGFVMYTPLSQQGGTFSQR